MAVFKRPLWIFFDLDDTLWNFKKNSLDTLYSLYYDIISEKFSFRKAEDFIDKYHSVNHKLWEDYNLGRVTIEFLRTERWRKTLYPEALDEESLKASRRLDSEYIRRLSEKSLEMEGASELLKNLSKENMIGIITNGFIDAQYNKLFNSGLWRYITRTIINEETGFKKPDPEIFSYAIEETGASHTPIFIGDNLFTDILGALKSKWKVIWLDIEDKRTGLEEMKAQNPDVDFNNLLAVTSNLKEIGEIINKLY